MQFRPRLTAMVYGVALATGVASGSAFAGGWASPTVGDSGQSPNTVMGNGLNPRGLDPSLSPDPNGLSEFRQPVSHTPSGQLYSVPWAEPETTDSLSGGFEAGLIWTNAARDAAKFKEYRDFDNGFIINHFNLSASGAGGKFLDFEGGGVGRDDQYYFGSAGVYNDFKIRGFYNEIPHVFSTTAQLIWNGAGTSYLALKPSIAGNSALPGATINSNQLPIGQLRAAVGALPDEEIGLIRKKGGFRLDKTLGSEWSAYAEYSLERRTGDRTFGQTGGGFPDGANGQPIQVVEPIDYNVQEFASGLSFADGLSALNVRVEASIFQDAYKEVLWENPFVNPLVGVNGGNGHVDMFSTPPNNQEFGVKADYMRALPNFWNGSFNSTVSFATQSNDETLQPETSHVGLNCNTVADCSFVNQLYKVVNGVSVPTLSQSTSDLRNNISLVNLKLALHPQNDLSLNGSFRWYNQATHNSYVAFNPAIAAACGYAFAAGSCAALGVGNTASGPYGYSGEDTNAGGASSATDAYNTANRRRSTGSAYRTIDTDLGADWDFARKQSFNFNYENENVYRALRERDWTYENKFKFGYVNRDLASGTLRTSYEYARRRGDDWNIAGELTAFCGADPTSPGYGGCEATFIGTNGAGFGTASNTARAPIGQKYDLADRDSHTVILRYNTQFTNTLDGMVTAKEQIQFFPDPLGRDTRREQGITFDLGYQPTTTTNISGYYTYQAVDQSQISLNDDSGTAGDTCTAALFAAGGCTAALFAPGSIYTNPSQFFRYDTQDRNHVFGLTFAHLFENSYKFDSSFQYTRTRSPVDYQYFCGITATAANGAQTCAGAGVGGGVSGIPNVVVAGYGLTPDAFSFPDLVYNRIQLNLNLTVPVSKAASVHFLYSFDHAGINDWHYDGLASGNNILTNAAGTTREYYLDSGPAQPYTAHTVGAFFQYKM